MVIIISLSEENLGRSRPAEGFLESIAGSDGAFLSWTESKLCWISQCAMQALAKLLPKNGSKIFDSWSEGRAEEVSLKLNKHKFQIKI